MLRLEVAKVSEEALNQSVREYKSYMIEELQTQKSSTNSHTYTGPNTLEEWEALRQERRQSNVELTLNGLLQLVSLMVVVVVGVVAVLVLGPLTLVLSIVLDFLVAPFLQCFCPGGFHGGSDPFGDDELPFIVRTISTGSMNLIVQTQPQK